jgi:site-specific DNA recombinase
MATAARASGVRAWTACATPRRARRHPTALDAAAGYRLDPERPRDPAGVRLEEAEAAVIRDLFARFADEGAAVAALVQHLHRLGIPSPRGHRSWSTSVLRNVLSNPVYLGQVFANRLRRHPAERRR